MKHQHWLSLSIIAIVLALQFIVPAVLLFSEGPNRWGWQMYSRDATRPAVVAVSVDDRRERVRLGQHLFQSRAELRFDAQVMEQLCDRIDGVASFEVTDLDTGEVTAHQCND